MENLPLTGRKGKVWHPITRGQEGSRGSQHQCWPSYSTESGVGIGFLWYMWGVGWVLSKGFCPAQLPLSWSFGYRKKSLLKVFILSAPYFWVLTFSRPQKRIYKQKYKTGNSPPPLFCVLKSLANLRYFVYLSEPSHIYFICFAQSFYLQPKEETGWQVL